MKRTLILVLTLFLIPVAGFSAVPDEPFEQPVVHRHAYDSLGIAPIRAIEPAGHHRIWALTDSELYLISDASVRQVHASLSLTPETVMTTLGETLILATERELIVIPPNGQPRAIEHRMGVIEDIATGRDQRIRFATSSGLVTTGRGIDTFTEDTLVVEACYQVSVGLTGITAVVDEQRLWMTGMENPRYEWIDPMVGYRPTGMAFVGNTPETERLWIVNEDCAHTVDPQTGRIDRIDAYSGLPLTRLTCVANSGGAAWIGSEHGAARFFAGEWRTFQGPRWLVGEAVLDIASSENHGAWLLTEAGVTHIKMEEWTLAEKAQWYAGQVYPRHDRHGLVAGVDLAEPGNPQSYQQRSEDNDGLWTSMYLAALCFQYAVTNDEAVREKIWHHVDALERLQTITGMDGFIARSFVTPDELDGLDGEWHATPDGEWYWKGDTSSDELVGHMFVYPLVHDLVAQTDDEKQRIQNVVSRIMLQVIEDGFYMRDVDGEPTRWGVFAPEKLNDDPDWSYERGLNSLQILAHLGAAHALTGDDRFRDAYYELVTEHDYARNILNQKVMLPWEENHSDDELAFLPYYILFRYNRDAILAPIYEASIQRAWERERPERASLWNLIYGISMDTRVDVEETLWTLQRWPLELITWNVSAEHRVDVQPNRYPDRFDKVQYLQLLAPDERPVMRWNANPYILDGGNGGRIHDPGAFLLPYWMARYYEWVE